MARLQIGFADREDAPELSRLLTESTRGFAMPAFALDRDEDIFRIMDVRGTDWKIIVARDTERDGRLAAYASVAYRQAYVNGALRRVPHLLDVYFSPEYRGGMLLSRSYRFVREYALHQDGFAQTQVCIDNNVALGAFTSGRGGLPAYLPYGDHAFITVPVPARDASIPVLSGPGREVRRATISDIPAMQAFFSHWAPKKQFYPLYEFDRLADPYYLGLAIGDFFLAFDHGRLAGMAGTWDQQAFKATHYLGGREDPKAGGAPAPANDRPLFLHCLVTERNDPGIFASLLEGMRREYRGSDFGFMALGLDAKDGLRYALDAIPHRASVTHHFLVCYGEDPRPGLKPGLFYLDSARC
ncbi:MAG: hypothetical protein JWP91_2127 [Fibrobacteres bacterium]|nr:hypothetical protein [Fibrobacterota bacterium]